MPLGRDVRWVEYEGEGMVHENPYHNCDNKADVAVGDLVQGLCV